MSTENGKPVGRVLPPEEWAEKLKGTSLEGAPLNEHCGVVVVEIDGQVVACWAILTTVHVEGLWEAESHRGHAGVGRALLATMLTELRAQHIPEVITNADTPEVEKLLKAVGAKPLPGTSWVLDVREG